MVVRQTSNRLPDVILEPGKTALLRLVLKNIHVSKKRWPYHLKAPILLEFFPFIAKQLVDILSITHLRWYHGHLVGFYGNRLLFCDLSIGFIIAPRFSSGFAANRETSL